MQLIRTMAVYKDGTCTFNLTLTELRHPDIAWYWVDFKGPNRVEQSYLKTFFDFHPLAVEDCLHYVQRPKLNYFNGYRFLILQSLKEDMNPQEVDIFLSSNYIVTYYQDMNNEIEATWEKVKEYSDFKNFVPEHILYLISDEIIDRLFPIAHSIEDEIQEIEEMGSESDIDMIDSMRKELRRLSKLRKIVRPMRDLMYRVLNSSHVQLHEETKIHLHDVHEHLVKLSEIIDDNREVANDIRESYISTNSHKMNQIMKTLTVFSVIFLPITFLVGVYGMNFENLPELHTKYGYFVLWGVMLSCIAWMLYFFKKKKWF